ncbi:hypothetical protein AWT69_004470 [Pseudomonas putida]|nr:hypothetical protein AWT69_004470 [Pseudomonas putida]
MIAWHRVHLLFFLGCRRDCRPLVIRFAGSGPERFVHASRTGLMGLIAGQARSHVGAWSGLAPRLRA